MSFYYYSNFHYFYSKRKLPTNKNNDFYFTLNLFLVTLQKNNAASLHRLAFTLINKITNVNFLFDRSPKATALQTANTASNKKVQSPNPRLLQQQPRVTPPTATSSELSSPRWLTRILFSTVLYMCRSNLHSSPFSNSKQTTTQTLKAIHAPTVSYDESSRCIKFSDSKKQQTPHAMEMGRDSYSHADIFFSTLV